MEASAMRRRSKNLAIIFLASAVLGCQFSGKPEGQSLTGKMSSIYQMEPIIREAIPLGTASDVAARFMKSEGFTVHEEVVSDYRYAVLLPNGTMEKRVIPGARFFQCNRSKNQAFTVSTSSVGLILDDAGTVKELVFSQDLTGL